MPIESLADGNFKKSKKNKAQSDFRRIRMVHSCAYICSVLLRASCITGYLYEFAGYCPGPIRG